MAFQSQAEYKEPTFTKISDVPLLKSYAKDKKFCKSGIFQVEHVVPPGRFQNFTLLNYTINVRVNVGPNNEDAYKFLNEYWATIDAESKGLPWLGCQITDRMKGYVNIGTDEEKAVDWTAGGLGRKIDTCPF